MVRRLREEKDLVDGSGSGDLGGERGRLRERENERFK